MTLTTVSTLWKTEFTGLFQLYVHPVYANRQLGSLPDGLQWTVHVADSLVHVFEPEMPSSPKGSQKIPPYCLYMTEAR